MQWKVFNKEVFSVHLPFIPRGALVYQGQVRHKDV
jgi:hypothetical protein